MRTLDLLRGKGIGYAILRTSFDRFQAEKKSYPDAVRLYEELFGASDMLYEVKPTGRTKGPVIRVLKLRQ
jgi:hypothetical protein